MLLLPPKYRIVFMYWFNTLREICKGEKGEKLDEK